MWHKSINSSSSLRWYRVVPNGVCKGGGNTAKNQSNKSGCCIQWELLCLGNKARVCAIRTKKQMCGEWCRSWNVTFHLPAWETQPLVLCHPLYKLQLTSWNKKNLVAMASSRILMICLEELLCRGFMETTQFNAAEECVISMTTMASRYLNGQKWLQQCFVLSGAQMVVHVSFRFLDIAQNTI